MNSGDGTIGRRPAGSLRDPEDFAVLEARADYVASRIALMANPRRLVILCRLAAGEASVGQIHAELGLSQSALSQHLGKLREGGLVETRREAQTIYYRLADAEARLMMEALYRAYCGPAPPVRAA